MSLLLDSLVKVGIYCVLPSTGYGVWLAAGCWDRLRRRA